MRSILVAFTCASLLATGAVAQSLGPGGNIPVVANLPGVAGTFWRSDVIVTNASDTSTSVMLKLLPEIRDGATTFTAKLIGPLDLPARSQLNLPNVVQSRFGLIDAKGSLQIYTTNGVPVALASRTYTYDRDSGGSYGQEVSGILAAKQAWVAGVEHDGLYRTNIGIVWLWDTPVQFTVTVFKADGSEAGSGVVAFPEAGLQQKSLEAFGVGTLIDGYVVISSSDPDAIWYAYGSRVDQTSGDAVYRPAKSLATDLP